MLPKSVNLLQLSFRRHAKILIFAIAFCCAQFSYAQPANDNIANATPLTLNSCSADGAYNTLNATPDGAIGSCWPAGPNANVWFSFVANATGTIQINLDNGSITGDMTGDMRYAMMALWDASGTIEIACSSYSDVDDDISILTNGLTNGATYLISVDRHYDTPSSAESFKLCLNDTPTNDYFEGAINIDGFMNSCSSDAAFSTLGATADRNGASCWPNVLGPGPYRNVWFEVTVPATGTIEVKLDRGDTKGGLQTAMLALWEDDGTTEVSCNSYRLGNDYDDVSLLATGLPVGATYYVSVDNTYIHEFDTFTLCLSDQPTNDYYEGATDITSLIGTCSADEAYSTLGNTFDRNTGSCWPAIVNHNTWFRFDAPSSGRIQIDLDRGGAQGTLRHAYMSLWATDGTTELACTAYSDPEDDLRLQYWNLTPGTSYYVSVDNRYITTTDTFALCLDAMNGPDTDNDGVADLMDLDDDNDGILDADECIVLNPELVGISGANQLSPGDSAFVTDVAVNGTNLPAEMTINAPSAIGSATDINIEGEQFGGSFQVLRFEDDNGVVAGEGLETNVQLNSPEIVNIIASNGYGNTNFNQTDTFVFTATGAPIGFTWFVKSVVDADISVDGNTITITGNSNSGTLGNAPFAEFDIEGSLPISNVNVQLINNATYGPALNSARILFTFCEDHDNDGIKGSLDLDSDGDGIPDNVEAQTSTGYLPPSADSAADYLSNNGVNSAYLLGLTPVNTDGTDTPDFIDLDSDNEGGNDIAEAMITLSGDDVDSDGLDDNMDAFTSGYDDPAGTIDDPTSNPIALPDTDNDLGSGGDLDFRDASDDRLDTDNDGVVDAVDLDDDNDGIPDIHEQGTMYECSETFIVDGAHTVNTHTTSQINSVSSGVTWDLQTTNGITLDTTDDPNFNNVVAYPVNPEFQNAQTHFLMDMNTDSNVGQHATLTITFPNPVKNPTMYFGNLKSSPGVGRRSVYYELNNVGVDMDILFTDGDFHIIDNRIGTTFNDTSVRGTGLVRFNGVFNTLTFTIGHFSNINEDGPIRTNLNLGYYDCVTTGFASNADTDNDGIVNSLDLDSDNDGIYDAVEAGHAQPHTNGRLDGSVGTDGLPDAVRLTPDYSSINYDIAESTDDADLNPNFLDLDSDGDGIPDNVEAQTTTGYILPNATVDANGVDLAYTSGLIPTNTDGTDLPDYLDLDSDNEGGSDTTEARIVLDGVDSDNDGLDDETDANTSGYLDPGGTIDNPLTAPLQLSDIDGDANSGGDVDFRDATDDSPDNDNDGIVDSVDLDDDNDGILDTDEGCGNFIINGSFEHDNFTDATAYPNGFTSANGTFIGTTYNTNTLTAWNYTQNLDGWLNSGSFGGGTFAPAVDGSQYIDIVGNNNVTGGVSNELTQDVTLVQGESYTFSFYWGEDIGHQSGETVTIEFDIIDSNNVAILDETLTTIATGEVGGFVGPKNWFYEERTFVATTDDITVRFSAQTPASNESSGAVLDLVSLRYSASTVCADTDNDGVPDAFDLDSDNDGIYDAVESGHNQAHTNGQVDGLVGADGIPDAVQDNPDARSVNYSVAESGDDSDTIANFLDLDADGDGIPDNVEAQTTTGYTPLNTDNAATYLTNNGVNTAYLGGLTPTNTDGTDSPDYLDTDSDNEGGNDTVEAGITLANADADNDGLDDATDATADYSDVGGTIDNPLTGPVQLPDMDSDAGSGGDVDFRDAIDDITDSDNDTYPDSVDLDDDNDGILDTDECGPDYNVIAATNLSFFTNVANAEGDPGTTYADNGITYQGQSELLLQFPEEAKIGETVRIYLGADPSVTSTNFQIMRSNANGDNINFVADGSNTTPGAIREVSFTLTERLEYFKIISYNEGARVYGASYGVAGCRDTDNDGIINSLDLDSDNDGCPDALEGAAPESEIGYAELNPDGSINDGVDANGVPNMATGGQGIGTSKNAAVQAAECSSCDVNNPEYVDTDGDLIGDYCDQDDDNDGILDSQEALCSDASLTMNPSTNTWQTTGVLVTANTYYEFVATSSSEGSAVVSGGPRDGQTLLKAAIYETGPGRWVDLDGNRYFGDNTFDGPPRDPFDIPTANLQIDDYRYTYTYLAMVDTNGNGQYDEGIDELLDPIFSISQNPKFSPSVGGEIYVIFSDDLYGDNSGILSYDLTTCTNLDSDNDGVIDSLDLDSDDDGCFDALEGDAPGTQIGYAELNPDGSIAGGVDGNGIPNAALGGQGFGTAQDDTQQATECDACSPSHPDYVDTDGDLIGDFCDLDDDNDGILDTEENDCATISTGQNISSDQNTLQSAGATVESGIKYIFDIQNVAASGIQTGVAVDGPFIGETINIYLTNTTQGGATLNGLTAVYNTDFTHDAAASSTNGGAVNSGLYLFYAIVDSNSNGTYEDGVDELLGPVDPLITNSIPVSTTTGPLYFYFNDGIYGDNLASIDYGIRVENCDADNDGIPNHLDPDSDNDGCFDAVEAGHTDPDADGYLGNSPVTVDSDGLVTGQGGYTGTNYWVTRNNPTLAFTTQPVDQTADVGDNVIFDTESSVTFTPISSATAFTILYQWQESTDNGVIWADVTDTGIYSGSNTEDLTLTSVTGAESGNLYRLITSIEEDNCNPPVISDEAQLYIEPTITIDDSSTVEGTNNVFTITASHSVNQDVVFNIAYNNVTTIAADYSGPSTVTLLANSTTVTFNVAAVDDAFIESTETHETVISYVSGGTVIITDDTGIGTITDNDTAGAGDGISVADFSVAETVAVGTADFVITYTGPTVPDAFTVDFTVADDSAISPDDYTVATAGTSVTFPAGTVSGSTQNVTINIVNDDLLEGDEQLIITLGTISNPLISMVDADGIGTIVDNEVSTITDGIAVSDFSVAEDIASGTADFVITYTGPTVQDAFTVDFTVADDTAISPDDYTVATAGTSVTFPAGTVSGSTQNVTINIVNDALLESDEQITITLGTISNTLINRLDSDGIGTITNDDTAGAGDGISVADFSVAETVAVGTADFVITYTGPTIPDAFTVDYVIADGTAILPDDYTVATAGTSVTFPAGTVSGSTQNVTINIVNDDLLEGDEQLTITLGTISNPLISMVDADGVGTIVDNEVSTITDGIAVSDFSVAEDIASGTADFVITYTGPTVQDEFTVDFTVADDSAISPDDYTVATAGTSVTFPAGTVSGSTQNVTINIVNDALLEGDEQLTITLGTISNTLINRLDSDGVGTITNDDAAGAGDGISVSDFSVAEDIASGTADFVITYTGPTIPDAFTVDFTVADDSAISPDDYTVATAGTSVTFPAGTVSGSTQNVTINIVNDDLLEGDEQLTITLGTISNPLISMVDADGIGTIVDNEVSTITDGIAVSDFSVAEDIASGTADFVITYTGPTVQDEFTVDFTVADDSAISPDDYTVATAGTSVTFPAGTVSGSTQNVTINIVNDDLLEGDEQLTITLGTISNPLISMVDADGVGTIVDNEVSTIIDGIAVSDFSVAEDIASGTADFVITYTGPTVQDEFTVDFTVADDSAISPDDYTVATAGTSVTFPAGTVSGSTQNVTINIVNDALLESDEQLTITLGTISNTLINRLDSDGVGTITNDDAAGAGDGISVSDFSVDEAVNTVDFVITYTGPTVPDAFTVDYVIADGTAISPDDYSVALATGNVSFPANTTTGVTQTVTVTIADDDVIEADENLTITLSNISNVLVAMVDDTGIGTITDNDGGAGTGLSISDIIIDESIGSVIVEVQLSGNVQGGFTVDFATADGSTISDASGIRSLPANEPNDYTETLGTLTFTGTNNEIQTISIPIIDDTMVESNENFVVDLSNLSTTLISITDNQGLVTIQDNETARFTGGSIQVNEDVGTAQIPVTFTGGTMAFPYEINYRLQAHEALTPEDFVDITGTLTFSGTDGEVLYIPVAIEDDLIIENDEVFYFFIESDAMRRPSPTRVSTSGRGLVTILDNDSGSITFQNDDITVDEAAGTATVNVLLTGGNIPGGFTLDYVSTDDTAVAPDDYTANTGQLTFVGTDGEIQPVTITIIDDNIIEAVERLFIDLSNLSTTLVNIDDNQANINITDNDGMAGTGISFENDDITVDESVGTVTVNVLLTGNVPGGFTLDYTTTDDTAVAPDDYTTNTGQLTFVGTDGETQPITISILDDDIVETLERLFIDLSNLSTALIPITDNQATISIIDNDVNPDMDSDNDGIIDSFEDLNLDGDNDPTTDPTNSDNDALPDYLDIDSDNDGIPDNVEAQTTADYIPPSLIDANNNGVDDAYENGTEIGLIPVNTDGLDLPDYLDDDSDNDGVPDSIEAHDHNHDGIADVVYSGVDTDNDGLDDSYEGSELIDMDVNDEIDDPINNLPNTDSDDESDYRDIDDDGDGIPTMDEDTDGDMNYANDDWDNDGIPDYLDSDIQEEIEELEVFNVITPNNDGVHDVLTIRSIENYPNNNIRIYNRWGVIVFETVEYNNDINNFDGYSRARATISESIKLPVGTYYYILNYEDHDGTMKQLASYLYIN
ncbi:gliding motility-associated C-terminal domain-containing protein [Aurantibacter crassamenti]|uniref:Calx-beta domain-containing protein n=1 Tax=Aurantibacter crassamenti TaxID=1837375 RepID=UPI00193AB37E|nr:Calx-beta domain-containing protein [Aurantibacter crassamenti]MBM1107959.1 gliding motility-associated C-terminal domain-containing protein [Aurantibacter crassamenti]